MIDVSDIVIRNVMAYDVIGIALVVSLVSIALVIIGSIVLSMKTNNGDALVAGVILSVAIALSVLGGLVVTVVVVGAQGSQMTSVVERETGVTDLQCRTPPALEYLADNPADCTFKYDGVPYKGVLSLDDDRHVTLYRTSDSKAIPLKTD